MIGTPGDKFDVAEFEAAMANKGPTCSFATFPFTPEQRAKLEYVCYSRPDITHVAVAKVIQSWARREPTDESPNPLWGVKISDTTVARHRKRECLCPESKTGNS